MTISIQRNSISPERNISREGNKISRERNNIARERNNICISRIIVRASDGQSVRRVNVSGDWSKRPM